MAAARNPTFETLMMRMFTEPKFLEEFADGGTARQRALESIGFDPQDVQKINDELAKIDFKQIVTTIRTIGCSQLVEDVFKAHN